MERFTIEEIRNYLKAQDSLGDIFYNLSEENIRKAQPNAKQKEVVQPIEEEEESLENLRLVYKPRLEYVEFGVSEELEWTEITDENIVLDIIHLISDMTPYYTRTNFKETESRFNIDGYRCRIIKKLGVEGEIMEKLTDNSRCTHRNMKNDCCLDCDLFC